ncbi:MAG: hypothetical protein P4L34_08405 [Paludibacter sp.]|nr:hypothetical protein [Paludibacter sp.]
MRKLLIIIALWYFFIDAPKAQSESISTDKRIGSTGSLIVSFGPEYCFADTKEFPLGQNLRNNWNLSLGFLQKFRNNLGYKIGVNFGNVTGSDGDQSRMYSFTSKLEQISFQGEYTINIGDKSKNSEFNSIYFFLGAGLLGNSTNLKYTPRIDYLYKVNKPDYYNLNAALLAGFGYQYKLNTSISVGAEFNLEYVFSDYIDGFKPPYPDSQFNDVLQGFSLTVSYVVF